MAADGVFGTFVLDPAQSNGAERCAVVTLDDLGGGKFRFAESRIDREGKTSRREGIFAFDGADHPDGDGGTLAFMRVDDARTIVVSKGTLRATAMRTLAGDALTETIDGTRDGDAFRALNVYARGTGTCEPAGSTP